MTRRTLRSNTGVALSLLFTCIVLMPQHAVAQQQIVAPDPTGQEMLIKNTLIAVNHGMITGNFTVLRDLSTEQFRRNNSAGDLAATFANLRKQKIDLSPILVTKIKVLGARFDEKTGQLKYTGYFVTRPQAVVYSLAFREVSGGWMIDKISINLKPTDTVLKAALRFQKGVTAG